MQTKATVVAVDGKYATVESERMSACEGCHKSENGGCTVCSLMGADRKITARAFNPLGAVVGDQVVIESSTERILLYAALVFLVPLISGLIFWGVSALITNNILWQICSGCVGFVISFVGVFFYSRSKKDSDCDIQITEILKDE